jgi:signal transduction histidine kinase
MESASKKILIVDDSPELTELVGRFLEHQGFQVSTALNGQMAIEKVMSESPEIVLLDLILPDIPGKEVLKKIKEINNDTAVIMMTGYGGEEVAVDLMKGGADDYLAKPFEKAALLKSLQEVFKIRDAQIEDKKSGRFPSLEKFFPFLAHEIRNPLHAIGGALAIIQRRSNLTDEILIRSINIIQEEVQHLNEFVQECLDFVRPPTKSRFIEVEINEVISVVINIICHMFEELSQKIKISRDTDSRLPKVYANYEEIKRAFLNILKNSFEALEDGGEITIKTGFRPEPYPGAIEILFTDNGVGIKKENSKHLLTPFFTTKLRGTGLGLAICGKIIVERHSGKIQIESEQGKGTTVRIELPIGPPQESSGDESI